MIKTNKGNYQYSKALGFVRLPDKCEVINMDYEVEFEPETPEQEWETACQRVADLTDVWQWLGPKINAEKLTWVQIMDLVAANI
jgi:hypothetical protein